MMGPFPDAEQVLVDLLAPFGQACTYLPVDHKGDFDVTKMPVIWITRNGGSRDEITDRPILQVAVFARKRSASAGIAEQCREAVLNSVNRKIAGALVDAAREVTGVTQLPDIDPLNRMVQATYQLSFRRTRL